MPWFHPPSDYCFVVSEVRQVWPCSVARSSPAVGLAAATSPGHPGHLGIRFLIYKVGMLGHSALQTFGLEPGTRSEHPRCINSCCY